MKQVGEVVLEISIDTKRYREMLDEACSILDSDTTYEKCINDIKALLSNWPVFDCVLELKEQPAPHSEHIHTGTITNVWKPIRLPDPNLPVQKPAQWEGGVQIGDDAEFEHGTGKQRYTYTGKVIQRDEDNHYIQSGDLYPHFGDVPGHKEKAVKVPNADVKGPA